MKKILFILMLLISTSVFASSRDEAFDQRNGVISLLAFGRPPVPTAKLPEKEEDRIKTLPDITSPLPNGGTGVVTNLGSSATPGESLGTGGETSNSRNHENHSGGGNNSNPGGAERSEDGLGTDGKNHSGGGDGTNPGGHGNDSGSNNPGKGKGKKN